MPPAGCHFRDRFLRAPRLPCCVYCFAIDADASIFLGAPDFKMAWPQPSLLSPPPPHGRRYRLLLASRAAPISHFERHIDWPPLMMLESHGALGRASACAGHIRAAACAAFRRAAH